MIVTITYGNVKHDIIMTWYLVNRDGEMVKKEIQVAVQLHMNKLGELMVHCRSQAESHYTHVRSYICTGYMDLKLFDASCTAITVVRSS